MTFDQWFEREFWQIDEDERFAQQMRQAWEAGYEAGGRAQVEWQDYLDRYDS